MFSQWLIDALKEALVTLIAIALFYLGYLVVATVVKYAPKVVTWIEVILLAGISEIYTFLKRRFTNLSGLGLIGMMGFFVLAIYDVIGTSNEPFGAEATKVVVFMASGYLSGLMVEYIIKWHQEHSPKK